jgi:hypothetical protein
MSVTGLMVKQFAAARHVAEEVLVVIVDADAERRRRARDLEGREDDGKPFASVKAPPGGRCRWMFVFGHTK